MQLISAFARFAIFFCGIELAAWLLSLTLHVLHPVYESHVDISFKSSRFGWIEEGELRSNVTQFQTELQAAGANQYAVQTFPRLTQWPKRPAKLTDVPQYLRQAISKLFEQRSYTAGVRGIVYGSDQDVARANLTKAVDILLARQTKALIKKDLRDQELLKEEVERIERSGNQQLIRSIEFSLMHSRPYRVEDSIPFTRYADPTRGEAVLLFNNPLTHLAVLALAALPYFAPRPPQNRDVVFLNPKFA